MSTSNEILTALRDELVDLGLVRKPNDTTDLSLPPMHVEPEDGVPAPGDRDAPEDDATLVTTLLLNTELGEIPFDGYRRRAIADIRYRSRHTAGLQRARDLDAAIRLALVDRPDFGFGWIMGTTTPVNVLSSQTYAGLGRISASKETGYHETAKYMIEALSS